MTRDDVGTGARGERCRAIFEHALALLDDGDTSPAERAAAEQTVVSFVRVLRDDERCVTDLLAYVKGAIQRRRPRCRAFYVASAALSSIRDRDRAWATAQRVMGWAASAGDDSGVAYLLRSYCASEQRRCDVDPTLIERAYRSAVNRGTAADLIASLLSCTVKNEPWLRSFVEREMETIERSHYEGFGFRDIESIRGFLNAPTSGRTASDA